MYNGVLWVTEHQDKLEGLCSIGSSCHENLQCMMNQKVEGSVCHKCYANRYLKLRKTLANRLKENSELLRDRILESRELPYINNFFFRFESFGDLQNEIHLKNFINIANHNPNTTFTLWTKRLDILDEVFSCQKIQKPDNLIVVYSSFMLNQKDFEIKDRVPWFIDKQFTVYTPDYVKDNEIKINCLKGSKCMQCRKCYMKNDIVDIAEIVK